MALTAAVGFLSGCPAHFLLLSFSRAQIPGGQGPLSCRLSPRWAEPVPLLCQSQMGTHASIPCTDWNVSATAALLTVCFWPKSSAPQWKLSKETIPKVGS